jgi:hypothetical protein
VGGVFDRIAPGFGKHEIALGKVLPFRIGKLRHIDSSGLGSALPVELILYQFSDCVISCVAIENHPIPGPKAGRPAKALNVEDVASLKKTPAELAKAEVVGGQYAQLLLSRLSSFPLW